MKKEAYIFVSALSIMAAACGHAAPSSVKEASSIRAVENLRANHAHVGAFLPGISTKLRGRLKCPEAASVMCSSFQDFAGKEVMACITRSTKDGDWETIVIDLNGNSDLTDDQAIALPGSGTNDTVRIERDGKSYVFGATVRHDRYSARLTLSPTSFLTGTTALGGDGIAWAACDCNLSGGLDDGDTVYLDRNANGSESRENLMQLGPEALLIHDSKWHMVSASPSDKLVIGPYSGAVSTWTIDHSNILQDKDAAHTISFRGSKNQATLMDANPCTGLTVPALAWRRIYGDIHTQDKTITYRIAQLDLRKDVVLKLEKPQAKLLVAQRGDSITVDLRIEAPHDVRYVLEKTVPGPLIEVFSDDRPGDPISSGNMEYG